MSPLRDVSSSSSSSSFHYRPRKKRRVRTAPIPLPFPALSFCFFPSLSAGSTRGRKAIMADPFRKATPTKREERAVQRLVEYSRRVAEEKEPPRVAAPVEEVRNLTKHTSNVHRLVLPAVATDHEHLGLQPRPFPKHTGQSAGDTSESTGGTVPKGVSSSLQSLLELETRAEPVDPASRFHSAPRGTPVGPVVHVRVPKVFSRGRGTLPPLPRAALERNTESPALEENEISAEVAWHAEIEGAGIPSSASPSVPEIPSPPPPPPPPLSSTTTDSVPSFLPLDLFDAIEDQRKPEIELVATRVRPQPENAGPVYALSKYHEGDDGSFVWKKCEVNAYDKEQRLFRITWLDESKPHKWVGRFNLRFDGEDLDALDERIAVATTLRQETEQHLRWDNYVSGLDAQSPPIPTPVVSRILHRLPQNKRDAPLVKDMTETVQAHFQFVQNKLFFWYHAKDPANEGKYDALGFPDPPRPRASRWSGKISIPQYDYNKVRLFIQDYALRVQQKLIPIIGVVFEECLAIRGAEYPDFYPHPQCAVTLQEFVEQAKTHVCNIHHILVTRFQESMLDTVEGSKLFDPPVTEGVDIYGNRVAPLQPDSNIPTLLNLIAVFMGITLRGTLLDILESYVGVFTRADDHPPVFHVALSLRSDAVEGREMCFDTPPDDHIDALLTIFSNLLEIVMHYPRLDDRIQRRYEETPPVLHVMDDDEPRVGQLRSLITQAVRHQSKAPKEYASELLQAHSVLLQTHRNQAEYLKRLEETPLELEQVRKELDVFLTMSREIRTSVPDVQACGLFEIDLQPCRVALLEMSEHMATAILQLVADRARSEATTTSKRFEELTTMLKTQPEAPEELAEMEKQITLLPNEVGKLEQDIKALKQRDEFLGEYRFSLSPEEFTTLWTVYAAPRNLSEQILESKKMLVESEEGLKDQLLQHTEELGARLGTCKEEFAAISLYSNLDSVEEYIGPVTDLWENLKRCRELATLYNAHEEQFKLPITKFTEVDEYIEQMEPFYKLWTMASDWSNSFSDWMYGEFSAIDCDVVQSTIKTSLGQCSKLIKTFVGDSIPLGLSKEVKEQVEQFVVSVPLITALRTPGLRQRHWEQIHAKSGVNFRPTQGTTLSQILQLGDWTPHVPAIQEIATVASKEYSLEVALDKMQAEWNSIRFEVIPHRDSGTFIICSPDDIVQTLEDQLVKIQTMRGSPFIKPLIERVTEFEAKLMLISDVIDEWLTVQQQWLYLEPIFTSEEVQRQMPAEGRRFAEVDRTFRRIMNSASVDPKVSSVVSGEKVLDSVREVNRLLEVIQKGLNDYLETKRVQFPRFFFLSNDELLDILSNTKEPMAVQPHLRKCFEGINNLVLRNEGGACFVSAMASADGENVSLIQPVSPSGPVEIWLGEVEKSMTSTIREMLKRSLEAYGKVSRKDWLFQWPGQIVLTGGQIMWTRHVEMALMKKGREGLKNLFQVLVKQLEELTTVVRGDLDKVQRKTMGALIIIDVHARDVVQKMIHEGVDKRDAFEWMSQMRYYWEDGGCTVQQVQAVLDYGYEYLGNQERLVITPLTDRCYITLMGALHQHLGGAPAGPAGTGKTETVKDLAKALAMQCVVFNCSDGLDYISMGKFFKGLVTSGAWACFDEFNRIDLEVLSVIAQQILTIQRAILQKVQTFTFEGSQIALKSTVAIFITMNPGYAGRTELPDNLKVLFRPVAMMIPDYALISEIILFSAGFSRARTLAQKMVNLNKLSSEQLSSQDHYDFGMRALKTMLSYAASLKRQYPDAPEDGLVLRALRDCNVPKFVKEDVSLFTGIVRDLFPGLDDPQSTDTTLVDTVVDVCRSNALQPVDSFLTKVLQLYDTLEFRHGCMIVGGAGGGKTTCYNVLKAALNKLGSRDDPRFRKVKTWIMNPKSITYGQLYGQFDVVTREWTDGILATNVRHVVADDTQQKKWLIFDGPVDAIWIESMNSVLDDNRLLCLDNGERISLPHSVNLIFEVEDLAVASPATVSRCSMVYVEARGLGWGPLMDSWIQGLPSSLISSDELSGEIRGWFNSFVNPVMQFLKKECKLVLAASESTLVQSMLNLMDSFLLPYKTPQEHDGRTVQVNGDMEHRFFSLFMFCLVWSFGALVEHDDRQRLDVFLRQHAEQNVEDISLPSTGKMLFDLSYNFAEDRFKPWEETVPPFRVNPALPFHRVIVPTVDTIRYSFLAHQLITLGKPVLFIGPTGVGKTVILNKVLTQDLSETFSTTSFSFSARTSANQTQDILDAKMIKRRKGVFGPPINTKMVIFIDDLNMPAKEKYGAQPPLELLRQCIDQGGWYDRKARSFNEIQDVQFVAAMGPPGGGRNEVSRRLLRHFNVIHITEPASDSLNFIFTSILEAHFEAGHFSKEVSSLARATVHATIELYSTIISQLLPTPSKARKAHYLFNMRDLSKVFQGVMMAPSSSVGNKLALCRLWMHECQRVFADRLVNLEDRGWFASQLVQVVTKHFPVPEAEVLHTTIPLWNGYLSSKNEYGEVQQLDMLKAKVKGFLEDYNQEMDTPMDLVTFTSAVEHISRINRVLRQPRGSAMLVGLGGSGRQSLTRLASYIAGYRLCTVEIVKGYGLVEWKEDVRKVLRMTGMEGQPIVFLLNEAQIISDSFLEDINSLLNTGEVPCLWEKEDVEAILQAMIPIARQQGLPETPVQALATFNERVRDNLHIVLCLSPVGDEFRNRLRMFPSLVNCCTLDWFDTWSSEALQYVAEHILAPLELDDTGTDVPTVARVCVFMNESMVEASRAYREEVKRYNYVTTVSYLGMLKLLESLLERRRHDLQFEYSRMNTGVQKLLETANAVEEMQEYLSKLKPSLVQASKEATTLMGHISRERQDADATKNEVEKEEAVASAAAAVTEGLKDEAQAELDKALPALRAAEDALKAINKQDITEVKSMQRPPMGVIIVMEAVCILRGIPPRKVPGPKPGTHTMDYWSEAKILLNDPQFVNSLLNFDKENIPEAVIKKLDPYVNNPQFKPEIVSKASKACQSLCAWVLAMRTYHFIWKEVLPKKQKVHELEAELAEKMALLQSKRDHLHALETKIEEMTQQYSDVVRRKEDISNQVDDCEKRLERAQKLAVGLKDEQVRWTKTVCDLKTGMECVVGDVLLAAGTVAYLGAFTMSYRTSSLEKWKEKLAELGIKYSPGYGLQQILATDSEIREWIAHGLPNDALSLENATIWKTARRWPLFIDPQGQANKWIRKMTKAGLTVTKPSDTKLMRTVENCVQFGTPLLLENCMEDLPSTLRPLLAKETFKLSGRWVIRLGDAVIDFHPDFRFYMTSKQANPHYKPDICSAVTLLNFTITPEGLEDQLLPVVVAKERPDLEEQRLELMESKEESLRMLHDVEERILSLLSQSEANFLDDEELVSTLRDSKATAEKVQKKLADVEETEKVTNEARSAYKDVASRASVLYFCVADLQKIDPMYQYSLDWFRNLFLQTLSCAPAADNLSKRLVILNNEFLHKLVENVGRGLFEKDKLLFVFLLCTKIMLSQGLINPVEYRFFLSGSVMLSEDMSQENPVPQWLPDALWSDILDLSELESFNSLAQDFSSPSSSSSWRQYLDAEDPLAFTLPGKWNTTLSSFQKLMVLRVLRPGKCIEGIQDFIASNLGREFIESPPLEMAKAFRDSSPTIPLLFIISQGADPIREIMRLAEQFSISNKVLSISLGQGQGPIAEKMIEEAIDLGKWVVLQNCHLAASWMPRLEAIVDEIPPDRVNVAFRLWLTSMPTDTFPVSVLQNSVKLINEPPRGLKSNMLRSFMELDEEFFEGSMKPNQWKRLLFGLFFFHGVLIERRKFGPLGWNIPYEFNESDLRTCVRQLRSFLDENDEVPFKALRYLTAHINYGGRVTDDWDRRVIDTMVNDLYRPDLLREGFRLSSKHEAYCVPPPGPLDSYVEYVKRFPLNDPTEIFGLHENAALTHAQAEKRRLLGHALSLQPLTSLGSAQSAEETLRDVAADILHKIPPPFDEEAILANNPPSYEDSYSTVLVQEVVRYNRLLVVIRKSLLDIQRALVGEIVMSSELEKMCESFMQGHVPELWSSKAYPSLKPLGAWVNDLVARLAFIQNWSDNGPPSVFWFSGFFFPQAFLTATLQNFVRSEMIPIDQVRFDTIVLPPEKQRETLPPPDVGCYIYGLHMEGATWDAGSACIIESIPGELYTEMPIIWLKPTQTPLEDLQKGRYTCPVYKTVARAGTLSTTGHSTNFVVPVFLPSNSPPHEWIKRSVALFCSLSS